MTKAKKTVDDFVTQTFPINCKGRDSNGDEVLEQPVSVEVIVSKSSGSSTIGLNVTCPYNTGGHGQRCKASHPTLDKVGKGVRCVYSADIPYAFEKK